MSGLITWRRSQSIGMNAAASLYLTTASELPSPAEIAVLFLLLFCFMTLGPDSTRLLPTVKMFAELLTISRFLKKKKKNWMAVIYHLILNRNNVDTFSFLSHRIDWISEWIQSKNIRLILYITIYFLGIKLIIYIYYYFDYCCWYKLWYKLVFQVKIFQFHCP